MYFQIPPNRFAFSWPVVIVSILLVQLILLYDPEEFRLLSVLEDEIRVE